MIDAIMAYIGYTVIVVVLYGIPGLALLGFIGVVLRIICLMGQSLCRGKG